LISAIILVIIYLSFISMGLPDSLLGSAWPSISMVLNIPLHYTAYIFIIIGIGRTIASVSCDRMINRFGTGIVTLFGFLTLTVGVWGFSFSLIFLHICFWSFFLGFGSGIVDVTLNNYVALHYKARHMNWLHCSWGIGASIGPVIMSFYLANDNLWNLGYRAIGIILCCFTAILIITLPVWAKSKRQIINGGKNIQKTRNRELLKIKGVKSVLVIFPCFALLEIVIVVFGSSYLVIEKNLLSETAAQCVSLFFIGMTIGRLLSGFITIKLNDRQIIRLGYCIFSFGIITLILPINIIILMICYFIIGFGNAPIFPCLLHETPGIFGSEKSQAVMGLQMASATMIPLLALPLFGIILSDVGFNIFPLLIGALLIMTILLFEYFNKKMDRDKAM